MFYKKQLLIAGLLLAAGTFLAPGASLASRYVNGVEGIKAATVPGPGWYLRSYNLIYSANDLNDGKRRDRDVGFDLNVAATANRLIWVSDISLFGGTYFADVVVPFVWMDLALNVAGISQTEGGIGDVYLEPFGIAWHGRRWDAAVAFGVYLDNARFSGSESLNLGAGYKTYLYTAGGTGYFLDNNRLSLSVLARYEVNDEQDDTGIEFGEDFHFEYGMGYGVGAGLEVGVAGYYDRQTTRNKGTAAASAAGKHEVFAIGPEVAKFFPEHKWLVSLRGLREFEAKNAPEGFILNLTLTKIF